MMKKKYYLISTIILLVAAGMVRAAECPVDAGAVIYPAPQKACLNGAAPLPLSLSYVSETDTLTDKNIRWFSRALSGVGVTLKKGNKGSAQVTFTSSPDTHTGAFRDEGYRLEITADPLAITIRANSETGFLYAALTLEQMIAGAPQQDGQTVLAGEVDDYPLFPFRGILEGGYDVWQHENRSDVLRWMGLLKMNYFIYAPKEDPLFRRQWRKPFPPEEIDKYREYIDICNEANVIFAFSLSPALNMEYSSEAEFKTLVAKFRQIQDLGVRHFGIFFDDVLPYLSTPKDKERYENIAEAEADVTNRLLLALRKHDPDARLFFVPNQYWGWTRTDYWSTIRRDLEPEIEIGWTGIDIVSKKITSEHAQKFLETVGRPPAIGDNYSPLGALVRRDPDLYLHSTSFVNNPYAFAEDDRAQLSKFVNATIGDYAWNPEGYDPVRAMRMACYQLAGGEVPGEALLMILELNKHDAPSKNFDTLMADLEAIENNDGSLQPGPLIKALHADLAADDMGITSLVHESSINPLLLAQLQPKIERATNAISAAQKIAADATPDNALDAAAQIREVLTP